MRQPMATTHRIRRNNRVLIDNDRGQAWSLNNKVSVYTLTISSTVSNIWVSTLANAASGGFIGGIYGYLFRHKTS